MPAHKFPRRTVSDPFNVNVSGLPQWVPNIGKFRDVSQDFPSAADPDPGFTAIYRGTAGFTSVWDVWNSGVYAPTLGTYGVMLFFGGANRSYDGNAIIAYDIGARTHLRLSEPALYSSLTEISGDSNTTNVNVSVDGGFPNGTAFPCHTYALPTFLPSDAGGGALGSWVYMCHLQNNVNIVYNNFWRFDLSARTWSRWRSPFQHGAYNYNGMCYDSTRKRLWLVAPSSLYGLKALWLVDMTTSSIVRVTISGGATSSNQFASGNSPSQPAPAYMPNKDCLVFPGAANTMVCVDVSGVTAAGVGTAVAHVITQSGTACPSMWNNVGFGVESIGGMEYCSYDGNLWALNQFNGTTVAQLFKLTPPAGALTGTWTWSTAENLTNTSGETLALRASSSGSVGDKGIWGRFRYVPPLRSFIWSDAHNLRTQMGRPAAFA
jgi:hypothetical protein